VATLTKQDVLDIYSCRAYLNGLAARQATEHMTAEVLANLQLLVHQMTEEAQREDVRGYFALTVKFNEVIIECAGNQVLHGLLNSLGRRTLRLRYLSIATPGRVQAGLEFHRDIVEAFGARDAERAEALMMRQIFSAQEVLLRHFLGNEPA
jgi:DNA-binding GntR family transcriptional regulator